MTSNSFIIKKNRKINKNTVKGYMNLNHSSFVD